MADDLNDYTYTSPDVIKARTDLARQQSGFFGGSDPGSSRYSGLTGLLQGLGLGVGWQNQAGTQQDLANNQKYMQDVYKRAADAPTSGALASMLLKSDAGPLAQTGLGILASSKEKDEDMARQMRQKMQMMKLVDSFIPGGGGTPAAPDVGQGQTSAAGGGGDLSFGPVAGGVNPGQIPSAGMSVGSRTTAPVGPQDYSLQSSQAGGPSIPMQTPSQTGQVQNFAGRSDPYADNRRIAMLVAGGLLPKEAAELLAKNPQAKFQESYDTKEGEDLAKNMAEMRDTGYKAIAKRGTFDLLEKLAADPNTIQGMGADASITMRRIADAFGIKSEGLAPTQVFQALVNQFALEMRSTSNGGGMPGSMSDKDLSFLRSMAPSISNTPEGNLALIRIMKRINDRNAEVAKLASNYAENNNGRLDRRFQPLLSQWSEKHPLFGDMAQPQAQAEQAKAPEAAPAQAAAKPMAPAELDALPVGHIVTSPDGKRLVKRADGKWEEASPFADEATYAWQGIKEAVGKSPASKALNWMRGATQ